MSLEHTPGQIWRGFSPSTTPALAFGEMATSAIVRAVNIVTGVDVVTLKLCVLLLLLLYRFIKATSSGCNEYGEHWSICIPAFRAQVPNA